MAELNAEIAKLKAEAAEGAENKAKREEYEKKAAELEAKMADSEMFWSSDILTGSQTLIGCVRLSWYPCDAIMQGSLSALVDTRW